MEQEHYDVHVGDIYSWAELHGFHTGIAEARLSRGPYIHINIYIEFPSYAIYDLSPCLKERDM